MSVRRLAQGVVDRVPGGRRTLLVILVGAIVIAWVVPRVRSNSGPAVEAVPARSLSVTGPSSIEAGSPWRILVEDATGRGVGEVWGPWGVRRVEVVVEDGAVELPGDLTRHRGQLTALLTAGSATGLVAVDVVPGPAVDGIVPLAGPRSIVADGADWTMVSAIPMDRFGNSVADGTPVSLHVRRPDGAVDLVETRVDQLLSGVRVTAGTVAGRSTIRVSVDGATGPEVDVLEVPGRPVAVELLPPTRPLLADGRTLFEVATAPMADRFGNTLLDGTAASVVIDGPSGVGTLTSVTIDGRAEFVLEAPPEPGIVELRAVVDGVSASPLTLEFLADVAELPVEVRSGEEVGRSAIVEVGPVLTSLGGFVPDGTQVVVIGGEVPATSELLDGVAVLEVAATSGAELTVEVLGLETEVVIP